MADKTFQGHPTKWGNKVVSTILHKGPNPYPNAASDKTGGETLYASQFGLKYIESVIVSGSDDGTYSGRAVFSNVSTSPPQPMTSFRLMWFDLASAQVANGINLSGRYLRVTAIGTN